MSRVQIITKDGRLAFYVVPADLWERVRDAIEEAEDIADLERIDREDDGVRYPQAVALAMADGVLPVRAWREYRGMTQEQLAAASGVSTPYVSPIARPRPRPDLGPYSRSLPGCGWFDGALYY